MIVPGETRTEGMQEWIELFPEHAALFAKHRIEDPAYPIQVRKLSYHEGALLRLPLSSLPVVLSGGDAGGKRCIGLDGVFVRGVPGSAGSRTRVDLSSAWP